MIPQVRALSLDQLAIRLREKAMRMRETGRPLKVIFGDKVLTLDALTSLNLEDDARAFERDAQKLRALCG